MVKVGKKWLAPRSVSSIVSKSLEDGALFNIMLQRGQGHSILVNGAECVTLGHGLHRGPLAHPIWGTAIRPFLQEHPGYPDISFQPGHGGEADVARHAGQARTGCAESAFG